jgi:WS/DGAT/MGAT family acyltransferase
VGQRTGPETAREAEVPAPAGDAPLTWGAGTELNAFEAVMWRAEVDRTLRSPVLALEELDTAPDWDRFLAAHEWGVRMVPRFRQRVVDGPLGLGAPRWTDDPAFDLGFHVRRQRLTGGSGESGAWSELLDVAARLALTPFDRTRAPWEAVLVEGLPNGRAAYLLKLHHVATDGMGGMQLLGQLHSRTREPNPRKPQPVAVPGGQSSAVDALAHQVRRDAEAVPGVLREVGSGALHALRDPVGTLTSATRYGRSLRRVLSPPDAPGSPLLANRSFSWRFAALDVSFPHLRAAGKLAGGSFNDAYLAALLGGYRRYHEAMRAPVPRAVPLAIPISVRTARDAEGGNRIASARISGPVATADPAARIQEVRALLLEARNEPAVNMIGLMSPALSRLPGQVIASLASPMTKTNDLQASNVPGIGDEVYLAGARVERMYPYAPLPGCAAMITVVTHGQIACVGANFDAASFTEAELFVRCLVGGFAEVLELVPDAPEPVARL